MVKSPEKKSNGNFVRVERIEILMKREGYEDRSRKEDGKNREDFADAINMLPQNFSRCMTSGKVSDKTCRKIATAFPNYRVQWLMGDDDLMTPQDWADSIQLRKDLVADSMWGIIEKSLNKQGKSLKFVHRTGQHVDSTLRLHADCYYSVVDQSGSEIKRLTALEMIQFEEKIQEYCDFITQKYL